jgi:polyhydroxyalkanoate synthesis regulator phasin
MEESAMKTARVVGAAVLGLLGLAFGVALPHTGLLAENGKSSARPKTVNTSAPSAVRRSAVQLDETDDFSPIPASDPFSSTTPRGAFAPLQQKFVELMKVKAGRMSDDELKAATSELQSSLDAQDKEADAALQEAIEKLREVIRNYQGTASAHKARSAIQTMGFNPDEVKKPAAAATPDESLRLDVPVLPQAPLDLDLAPPVNRS